MLKWCKRKIKDHRYPFQIEVKFESELSNLIGGADASPDESG